jgi:hypothetical protein
MGRAPMPRRANPRLVEAIALARSVLEREAPQQPALELFERRIDAADPHTVRLAIEEADEDLGVFGDVALRRSAAALNLLAHLADEVDNIDGDKWVPTTPDHRDRMIDAYLDMLRLAAWPACPHCGGWVPETRAAAARSRGAEYAYCTDEHKAAAAAQRAREKARAS